jgi:DNA-binding transcriptional MerR regulator
VYYRPKVASQIVGIGESTLRAWSHHFTDLLSPHARPGAAPRRYAERDLAIFKRAKELLDGGLTFDQAAERLAHELGGVGSAIAFIGDARRVADLEAQIEVLQLLVATKDDLLHALRMQLVGTEQEIAALHRLLTRANMQLGSKRRRSGG